MTRHAGALIVALLALSAPACMPAPGGMVGGTLDSMPRDQWEISWDQKTGVPSSMSNRSARAAEPGSVAVSDTVARAAAHAFFAEQAQLFRLRPELDGFRCTSSYVRDALRHLRFEQVYAGVLVEGGGFALTVLPSGQVGFVTGRFHPDIHLDPRPAYSAERALDIAIASASQSPGGNPLPPELKVLPRGDQYHLAWDLTMLPNGPFGGWRALVDAASGQILQTDNRVFGNQR